MKRKQEISTFLEVMHPGKDVFEIAVIKDSDSNKMNFGYFRNVKKATKAILKAEGDKPSGIYITANPCDKSLLDGDNGNRIGPGLSRTKDGNIARIKHLLIDIDHKGAGKMGTTDEEHRAVLKVAKRIRKWTSGLGWPDPTLLDSGNGAWLIYETNLENSQENKHMIHRCLKHINSMYGSHDIKIDESVYNPSRLIRVPGTVNRKGPNDEKHPHRTARILSMSETKRSLKKKRLQTLAGDSKAISAEGPSGKKTGNTLVDVDAYLRDYGISHKGPIEYHGGNMYPLEACPFNPDHKPRESAIIQDPKGKLYFKCFHNSCRNYKWRDVRKQISGNDKLDKYLIQKTAATSKPSLSLIRADNLVKFTQREPPLIKGMLELHGILLIRGPSGIGKSMLALNIALNIANPPSDKQLYKQFQINAKVKVLVVQSENSRNSLHKRLSKMTKENPRYKKAMSDIYFLKRKDVCTVSGNLQDELFMESIEKSIIRKDIGLIILDPLISYHEKDENDNRGMRQTLQVITDLCEMYKVAAIVIHHDGKSASSSSKGGRGASSIGDWAPNIISLSHADKMSDVIKVTHVKGRDFASFDMLSLRRTEDFDFERVRGAIEESQKERAVKASNKAKVIEDEIFMLLKKGETDQKTIVKQICNTFKREKVSQHKARRVAEKMLEEGKILSKKDKNRKVYYLGKSSTKPSKGRVADFRDWLAQRKSVAKNNH